MNLKEKIRTIPDFPQPGVQFRDITTLLKDPHTLSYVVDKLYQKYKDKGITKILGIESRGFIFASLLAFKLNLPLILARKSGKLPALTTRIEYELEYGKDAIEIHNDAISPGDKVLIIDDLLATGGTSLATAQLVERLHGKVSGFAFVIDLPDLKGKEKLKDYDVYSLVKFKGK